MNPGRGGIFFLHLFRLALGGPPASYMACTRSFQELKLPDHGIDYPVHCSKGKAVPLQAWTGPEGSRKLRFPDFVTTAQDGG